MSHAQANCPYCRERIQPDASKCPHCMSDMPDKTRAYLNIALGVFTIPVGLVFLYLTWIAFDSIREMYYFFTFIELILSGLLLGVLLAIGLAPFIAISSGAEKLDEYKTMMEPLNSDNHSSEGEGTVTPERGGQITKSSTERGHEMGENAVLKLASFGRRINQSVNIPSIRPIIPSSIWGYGVGLGSLLWLSLWILLNNETAFGFALFAGWIILPLSIFFDARHVRRRIDWSPRWYVYVVLSFIPVIAPLFGGLWLYQKHRKIAANSID